VVAPATVSDPDPHSRDQLRQAYVEAWRKHRSRLPLAPLEAMLADIIERHPEYHALLESADGAAAFEPDGSGTAENPFLHLGLHAAVHEQLAIDRPPGVRELHSRWVALSGDPHGADHVMMEALAETLWEAQRSSRTADETRYLERARRGFDIRPKG
jgi:hypothetical protein